MVTAVRPKIGLDTSWLTSFDTVKRSLTGKDNAGFKEYENGIEAVRDYESGLLFSFINTILSPFFSLSSYLRLSGDQYLKNNGINTGVLGLPLEAPDLCTAYQKNKKEEDAFKVYRRLLRSGEGDDFWINPDFFICFTKKKEREDDLNSLVARDGNGKELIEVRLIDPWSRRREAVSGDLDTLKIDVKRYVVLNANSTTRSPSNAAMDLYREVIKNELLTEVKKLAEESEESLVRKLDEFKEKAPHSFELIKKLLDDIKKDNEINEGDIQLNPEVIKEQSKIIMDLYHHTGQAVKQGSNHRTVISDSLQAPQFEKPLQERQKVEQFSLQAVMEERSKEYNPSLNRAWNSIDWTVLENALNRLYECDGIRTPFDALMMFKAILLAHWYGLSVESELDRAFRINVSFKHCCKLRETAVPDIAAIKRFHQYLLKDEKLEKLLNNVTGQLQEKGLTVEQALSVGADIKLYEARIQINIEEEEFQ